MKKNKFFFLLMLPAVMLVSVFISCSTDDPDPNAYDFNDEIATGTWKIDSVVGFYPNHGVRRDPGNQADGMWCSRSMVANRTLCR